MIGDRIEVNIAGGLDVDLPRMVRLRQKFPIPIVDDIGATIAAQFDDPRIRERVQPGMRIAVGCGSRGIANVVECAAFDFDAEGNLALMPSHGVNGDE